MKQGRSFQCYRVAVAGHIAYGEGKEGGGLLFLQDLIAYGEKNKGTQKLEHRE